MTGRECDTRKQLSAPEHLTRLCWAIVLLGAGVGREGREGGLERGSLGMHYIGL